MKKHIILKLICLFVTINISAKEYNILDFGAKSSPKDKFVKSNTKAIQAAIDACSKDGGGSTVYIPKGKFVTGTLFLKSDVTINMAPLAWIYGSPNIEDYAEVPLSTEEPHFSKTLFYVVGAKNIKIIGDLRSEINGRGYFFKHAPLRPKLFRIEKSNNIEFQGFRIKFSGSWCTVFTECDNIKLNKLTVVNDSNRNNDGFDFDGCSNVWVTECNLQVGDDAICLKSSVGKVCENINVSDCTIRSFTAAVKLGTASMSGFKNVTIKNCQFYDCVSGGVKLLAVDGAILENIVVENVKLYNCGGPFFLRLGNRGRDYTKSIRQVYKKDVKPEGRPVGQLKNITLKNIEGRLIGRHDSTECIMFTGIPKHYIENVTLENINLSFSGHGKLNLKDKVVPEDEARYPEQSFFGPLPAYGMYFRHVKGLKLKNVHIGLRSFDDRSAIVMDDVIESTFENVSFDIKPEAESAIIIKDSKDLKFAKINSKGEVNSLFEIQGSKTNNIQLKNTAIRKQGIREKAIFTKGASKKTLK